MRISCAGYPTKTPYEDFADHFWPLAYDQLSLDDRALTRAVIAKVLGSEGFQLGKTKVFLRAGKMAALDKRRTEVMHAAAGVIQRNVRGWLARLRFRRAVRAVVLLQAAARGMLARRLYNSMRRERAATLIQAHLRGFRVGGGAACLGPRGVHAEP